MRRVDPSPRAAPGASTRRMRAVGRRGWRRAGRLRPWVPRLERWTAPPFAHAGRGARTAVRRSRLRAEAGPAPVTPGAGRQVGGMLVEGVRPVLRGRVGNHLVLPRGLLRVRTRGEGVMSEWATLTVRSIELREVALPLVRPFRTSFGEERDKRAILVRVGAEVGGRDAAGWGQ